MARAAPRADAKTDGNAFPEMMAPFDIDTFSKINANALKSFLEANTKLVQAGSAMNAEVVDFVGRRLERDAAIGECLIDCRSFDEAYEVYTDFIKTSVADYLSEFQRLLAIGEDALSGTAATLRHEPAEMPAATKTRETAAAE